MVQVNGLLNSFFLFFSLSVINELDGLSRDLHFDKFKDPQHAQNLLENARYEDNSWSILVVRRIFWQRSLNVDKRTAKGFVLLSDRASELVVIGGLCLLIGAHAIYPNLTES